MRLDPSSQIEVEAHMDIVFPAGIVIPCSCSSTGLVDGVVVVAGLVVLGLVLVGGFACVFVWVSEFGYLC